jgi:uncharacterized lipoprotein YajG
MKIKSMTPQALAILAAATFFASCQKSFDSKSNSLSKANLKQATDMAGLQSLLIVNDVQQMVLAFSPNSNESAQILAGSCLQFILMILLQMFIPVHKRLIGVQVAPTQTAQREVVKL